MTGRNKDLQVGDYVKFTNDDAWATGTIQKIEEQSGGMWRLVTLAVDSASPPDTWDCEAPTAGGEHGFGLWPGDAPPMMAREHRQTYQSTQGVPCPAKECETCCIPGATAATGRCGHGHLYRSKVRDTVPATCPVLYDGITAEQCLELYVERQQEHGDSADCYMMTPLQLAAARELWSAQLRAKREAAKEKERCAVTYCEVGADD